MRRILGEEPRDWTSTPEDCVQELAGSVARSRGPANTVARIEPLKVAGEHFKVTPEPLTWTRDQPSAALGERELLD